MIQNNVIRSDDPQAVEKLQAKLDKLTKQHARMKEINAYFKKHATALGCPGLSDAEAAKLDERVQTGYSWEKQPYPSYILSGNTAEMRRLRQRIEEVSRTQNTEYAGWDFPGGDIQDQKLDLQLVVNESGGHMHPILSSCFLYYTGNPRICTGFFPHHRRPAAIHWSEGRSQPLHYLMGGLFHA